MIYIPLFSNFLKKARERNIESGIILFALCSLIAYISTRYFYVGLILWADLQILIGAIIGVRFAFKNQKPEQATLKYGVLTGLGGGLLSTLFISMYEWMLVSVVQGINLWVFIFIFLYVLISGGVIGLIMGALISTVYMYQEVKRPEEDKHIDEEFFKDLMED